MAAAGTEAILLELDPLSSAANHNGGAIHFGADGRLYVAVGDNANGANAQSLNTLHGKMLRLDKDGTIPADNPFYGQPGTGRMHINDVGAAAWEEINEGVRGANYGRPTTEGYTTDSRFRPPLYAYSHSEGCAITGGNPLGFQTGLSSPVDIRIASDGTLYYLVRGGAIRRITYAGSQAPSITSHPSDRTVSPGQATASPRPPRASTPRCGPDRIRCGPPPPEPAGPTWITCR